MNLFVYTGAATLNAAIVTSATDLTPLTRLPDVVFGDSEPITVKFLSAAGAYESFSGAGTHTLSVSIGDASALGAGAYLQTSTFTAITNGWSGRLVLTSDALRSAVASYLETRAGATGAPLTLQIRVTDADGNTETDAKQKILVGSAVSVATTANSTPVAFATFADVEASATAAAASAAAAVVSQDAASASASTASGHASNASGSASAAAGSASTADTRATAAAGSATTATTQATNAATSSSNASTYKDAAAASASAAAISAATATTQAALATTNGAAQVTLAAAQVTLATTQAGNASTSATAAGVSAAAALVSEAAALVSKNAAAASAATASAVSGSGNGTFSAAALTGVNSVTAASATNLTLAGGTAGTSSVVVSNTTAATTTTSGALRVGSNVGLSGNAGGTSYFGGQVSSAGGSTASTLPFISANATLGGYEVYCASASLDQKRWQWQAGTAIGDGTLRLRAVNDANTNGSNAISITRTAEAIGTISLGTATAIVSVLGTTPATSSAGALKIGAQTGSDYVNLGGGNIAAGGTGTFGGNVSLVGTLANTTTGGTTSAVNVYATGTTGISQLDLKTGDGTTSGRISRVLFRSDETSPQRWDVGMNATKSFTIVNNTLGGAVPLTIDSATNAAAFAGAVTIAGTVIHTLSATPASASAAGTVGTMSWDASYIYICTATNTWKRVAIATW
jgi:hypothetical protein